MLPDKPEGYYQEIAKQKKNQLHNTLKYRRYWH
jgi:hypothetical protein